LLKELVSILSKGYNPEHGIRIQAAKNPTSLLFLILIVTFITLGPVLLTDSFAATWGPVYGGTPHLGLSVGAVKLWVFLIDIFIISWMTVKTGGWKTSPFPSLTFSIPAIAILLSESAARVIIYTSLISLIYGVSLLYPMRRFGDASASRAEDDIALWVVTVLTLVLTTLIGIYTRHPAA
jgi:hypothetical protein